MLTFSLTSHAEVVVLERNIDLIWIERVLKNPARIEDDDTDHELQHSLGVITEYGNRVLRIVHTRAEPTRIITVFFDRSLKGKL